MGNNFAKLYQVGQHQLLMQKDIEASEEAPYLIKITTWHNGASASIAMYYTDGESRDKRFDLLGPQDAQRLLLNLLKAIS